MKTWIRSALVASTLAVAAAAHAVPTVILPSYPVDGIGPQQFDEGLIYSRALLSQQQAAGLLPGNTSNFDFAAGSGTFDVIVYSHNAPANPAPFAQSMEALTSGSFDGTWGLNAAGTIGALRTLLTVGGTAYQPMFVFDHNENQRNPNMLISGRVAVYRGANLLQEFALDTQDNGTYDADARITSCGSPTVGQNPDTPLGPCNIQVDTPSDTTYTWQTNGSGKTDYFAVFPTFDLYGGGLLASDRIVVQMSIRDMTSGFDELAIGGYLFANPPSQVPEPGSVALMAAGLVALGLGLRRRRPTAPRA